MIAINQREAEAIRKRYPKVFIVRTMKQRSKRHKYYCEEDRRAIALINEMRNSNVEVHKR